MPRSVKLEYLNYKKVTKFLSFEELRDQLEFESCKYYSRRDVEQYMMTKCNKCFNDCGYCTLKKIHESLGHEKLMEQWAYRNLKTYGNCYYEVRFKKALVDELEMLGFTDISYKPSLYGRGIILYAKMANKK